MKVTSLVFSPPAPKPKMMKVKDLPAGAVYSHESSYGDASQASLWIALPRDFDDCPVHNRSCVALSYGGVCHTDRETRVYVWDVEVTAKLKYGEE